MRAAVEESLMKRIRQIVVALVGLFYIGLLYPLCTELWHSKWLVEMHDNECEPMFITFLVALGVFLLLAVRTPCMEVHRRSRGGEGELQERRCGAPRRRKDRVLQ